MYKLYDFYQTNCGPCKMMNPMVDQLREELTDIEVIKVNLDDSHEVDYKSHYNLMSTPTFILEDAAGNVLNRQSGFMPYEKLKEFTTNGGKI